MLKGRATIGKSGDSLETGGKSMKFRDYYTSISFGVISAIILAASPASSQSSSLKDALVGTWVATSAYNDLADGSRFLPLGDSVKGSLMLDAGGHFSWILVRPDIPKFASNNRLKGTDAEFKATALGVLSYYGTYTVEDSSNSMTMHIEFSSFANFNGANQRRTVKIEGDQLTIVNAAGAAGGTAYVIWKRMK